MYESGDDYNGYDDDMDSWGDDDDGRHDDRLNGGGSDQQLGLCLINSVLNSDKSLCWF